MKPMRVLVLMHEDLVPPDSLEGVDPRRAAECRTEFDVVHTLRQLGHEVRPLGVYSDLGVIRQALDDFKPDIVFNVLEEFHGNPLLDQHVVSYLELLRQPYTGCNPRGLTLAHDKALCKKILAYHHVPVPRFAVFPRNAGRRSLRRPRHLRFPLFVKSLTEEGSVGIAQASIVHDDAKLAERIRFVHEHTQTDAIAEEYIEGRELYLGILGNRALQVLPLWEMSFDNLPANCQPIATGKVKWDAGYQRKIGVRTHAAHVPPEQQKQVQAMGKRAYRALCLSGYARLDLRLAADGTVYLIEANPNPQLADGEDLADSAKAGDIPYPDLLQRILQLGLQYDRHQLT